MNTERLSTIAKVILDDLESTEAVDRMTDFQKYLSSLSANLGDVSYQKAYAEAREALKTALQGSATNEFSPAWRQALADMGIDGLVGNGLWLRIREILDSNQSTLSVATNEIKPIAANVTALHAHLRDLLSAFDFLEIEPETLEPGECEIGFLIPRPYVGNHLMDLGEEFKELSRILGPFSEIATGSRPALEIRSISASAFGVFLLLTPGVLAAVSKSVEAIVNTYKKIVQFKKLRSEMLGLGMPKDALKGVDQEANQMMELRIGQLVGELMKEFTEYSRDGRQHELKLELKYSLNSLANRIDAGFNIEVRANPPAIGAGDGNVAEDGEASKHFATIDSAREAIQFSNETGQPILQLPEHKQGATSEHEPEVGSQSTQSDKETSGAKPRRQRKARATSTGEAARPDVKEAKGRTRKPRA